MAQQDLDGIDGYHLDNDDDEPDGPAEEVREPEAAGVPRGRPRAVPRPVPVTETGAPIPISPFGAVPTKSTHWGV